MFRKAALLAIAVIVVHSVAGFSSGADVLFVESLTPDPSWQTLIESGGHTFTLFDQSTYSLSLGSQASKDYVNSFDVIAMSGSNTLFGVIKNNGQTWHSQETPILTLAPYFVCGQFTNGSWQWFTHDGKAQGGFADSFVVGDATDPIWTGVTLSPDTPDLYDGDGRCAEEWWDATGLKPGVTVLATNPNNSR